MGNRKSKKKAASRCQELTKYKGLFYEEGLVVCEGLQAGILACQAIFCKQNDTAPVLFPGSSTTE